MIVKYLIFLSPWLWLAQGTPLPLQFQTIQFLKPPATSFTTRTEQFITSPRNPKTSRRHIAIEDFFSVDLPSPIIDPNKIPSWSTGPDIIFPSRFGNLGHFQGHHITPDFSDGLSYPDPFLRTGIEAKRMASYLYSKQLFFHEIPHVRALLYNQEERKRNGLVPHELGSLSPASPWHRFREPGGFGGLNSVFSF